MPVKNYYVTGNTSKGLVNLLESNITNCDTVIVLKHDSNKLKTAIFKKIIQLYEKDELVDVLRNEMSHKYLNGIILQDRSAAIISDEIMPAKYKAAFVIDLNKQFASLQADPDDLEKITMMKQSAYQNFAAGLSIHDKLEKIYINQMNFERAGELANTFITDLLQDKTPDSSRKPHVAKRLFGTNTADGVVNVVPEILDRVTNCWFIKGRAGTGKSTFMRKISKACHEYGMDMELYYCSFDPLSLDMVLIPELDFLIFDSTNPHEFFPEKAGDRIIDLYEQLVTPGTDEKFASAIKEWNSTYKSYMKKGIIDLNNAGIYIDKTENKYSFIPHSVDNAISNLVDKINGRD